MKQLHAIENSKMAAKIAQASASEPKAPWSPSGGISDQCCFHFGAHARLLLFACCFPIAGALFLMCPLLRCSSSELPVYEAQVTKAIAS